MLAAKEFVRSTLATHEKTRRLAELATDTLVEVVDACADRGVPLAGYAKDVTSFFKKEADDVLQAPYANLKNDATEQTALIQHLREQLRKVEQDLFEARAQAHVRERQLCDEEARSLALELALNEARARARRSSIEQVPALDPDSPTRFTHSHSHSENEPHTPSLQHAASTMTFGHADADEPPPPLELRGEDADEFLKAIGMNPDDADIFNKQHALDYSSDDDVPPALVPAVYRLPVDPDATAVAPETPTQPPKISRTESSPLGIPRSGTFGFPGGTPDSGRFHFGRGEDAVAVGDILRSSPGAGIPESGTFGFESGIPESSTFGFGQPECATSASTSHATTPADERPTPPTAEQDATPALVAVMLEDDPPEELPYLTPALVSTPFGHDFASLPAAVEMLHLSQADPAPGASRPSALDADSAAAAGDLAATLEHPLADPAHADADSALGPDSAAGPSADSVHCPTLLQSELGAADSGPAIDDDYFGPAAAPKLTLVSTSPAEEESVHDLSSEGPRASPSGITHPHVDLEGQLQNPWTTTPGPDALSVARPSSHQHQHQHQPSTVTARTGTTGADTFASVMAVAPSSASVHTYPPSRAASIFEAEPDRDSSGGHSFAGSANVGRPNGGVVHLNDASVRFPIDDSSKENANGLPSPGRARARSVGGPHKGRLAHMFEALERRLSIGRERADSSSASEASVKHVAHRLHKPRSRANNAGATVLGARSPAKEKSSKTKDGATVDTTEMGELTAPAPAVAATEVKRSKSPRISLVSRFSSLRDVKTRGT